MKNKVIHKVNMPKNWMINGGCSSMRYSGSSIYQWSFTHTLPKMKRLNIVYKVVEEK